MTKAHTAAEVESIIDQWNAGIGPDQLHDALGWSSEEYRQWVNGSGEDRERLLATFAPKDEIIGMKWHDFPAGEDFKIHLISDQGFVKMDALATKAMWTVPEVWHVARVPGSIRWIVRSTANGIARLAPAPNDFHSADAAWRRADHLNEETS